MVITSCICVVAALLWDYVVRTGHRWLLLLGTLLLAVLSAAGLYHYEDLFPGLIASGWEGLYDGKAMAGLIWLLACLLAFPCLVVVAIARFFCRPRRRRRGRRRQRRSSGVTRRSFLKGLAALIPVAAFATSGAGNLLGERDLDTTYHVLKYKNLPDYLDGYKIGQLSDLHMGLFFSPRRLQEALDAVAAQGVNRLEITGDLIDELALLPKARAILKANAGRFPDGIDFCYGNHEYYRSFDAITAMLDDTPVRVLRNSAFQASHGCGQGLRGCNGRDGRSFYIAATDYSFAKGDEAFAKEREQYVRETLAKVPEDAFVVMLAHHSAFIDEGFAHHIPLTCAAIRTAPSSRPLRPWSRPWASSTSAACSRKGTAGAMSTAAQATGCLSASSVPARPVSLNYENKRKG